MSKAKKKKKSRIYVKKYISPWLQSIDDEEQEKKSFRFIAGLACNLTTTINAKKNKK